MKLRVELSNTDTVKEAVSECFATDAALIAKWHLAAGSGLQACIDRTLKDVATTFDPSFRFFRVFVGDELAGYWGTEWDNYINLIFVKPQYRNKEFMQEFWTAIQESLAPTFYTALYTKNQPAIDFYSKVGTKHKEFEIGNNYLVSFVFTRK